MLMMEGKMRQKKDGCGRKNNLIQQMNIQLVQEEEVDEEMLRGMVEGEVRSGEIMMMMKGEKWQKDKYGRRKNLIDA